MKEQIHHLKEKIKAFMSQKHDMAPLVVAFGASFVGFIYLTCCNKNTCAYKDAMRLFWFFGVVFVSSRILSTITLALIIGTMLVTSEIFWLTGTTNVPFSLSSYFAIVFASTIGLMVVKGVWRIGEPHTKASTEE